MFSPITLAPCNPIAPLTVAHTGDRASVLAAEVQPAQPGMSYCAPPSQQLQPQVQCPQTQNDQMQPQHVSGVSHFPMGSVPMMVNQKHQSRSIYVFLSSFPSLCTCVASKSVVHTCSTNYTMQWYKSASLPHSSE